MLTAVFALGVTSVVALNHVSTVVGENLERKLTSYGANILISPKRETLSVSYGGFAMGDMTYEVSHIPLAQAMDSIRSIALNERLATLAPKLVVMDRIALSGMAENPATLQNNSAPTELSVSANTSGPTTLSGTQQSAADNGPAATTIPVGIVGVDWEQEVGLKGYWAINGRYPQQKDEIIAGAGIAQRLGLGIGDTTEIMGRKATVSGILHETGSDDDRVLLAGIGFVQQAANLPDKASFIEVAAICAGCPIEDITTQLSAVLPDMNVNALQSIVKQRMYSVHFVEQLVLSVSVVILLTACAMMVMSMLASVNERRKEIGILRSVGFSRPRVFTIFCLEALVIGAIAGVSGYLGGFAISRKVVALLHIADGAVIQFDPAHFALAMLAIITVATMSALFPAWKASRIEPSQALVAL